MIRNSIMKSCESESLHERRKGTAPCDNTSERSCGSLSLRSRRKRTLGHSTLSSLTITPPEATMISIAMPPLRRAVVSPAVRNIIAQRHLSMACVQSVDKLCNILEEYRAKK
jgi:hypothetical protein